MAIQSFYSVYFQPAQLPLEKAVPSAISKKIVQYLASQDLRVGKCMGRGRQGAVYALENNSNGQVTDILKIYYSWRFKKISEKYGARFAENLKHPSICSPKKIFYLTPAQDITFVPSKDSITVGMIMPFVKGTPLKEKYREINRTAPRLFGFGERLAEAADELFRKRFAHGDLHDENILVDEKFRPVIIDFDWCQKSETLSRADYKKILGHISGLINASPDIDPSSKQFLQGCFNRCYQILDQDTFWSQNPSSALPSLMISFMRACNEHIEEIQAKPVSKL
jgi:serine/threonine protein kinase